MKSRNGAKRDGGPVTAGGRQDGAVPQFRAGDRFCMIGDSITHSGLYHSLVHLFYATRFPGQRFEIANCGISGDSAEGAVRRFDWDIAPHRPTVAAIMLGMNDIGRELYGADKTGEAIEARHQAILHGYAANMTRLADLLQERQCRLIFVTPSIYDQTCRMPADNLVGCNDALGRCAEILKERAPTYGAALVDFHGPMTALNGRGQETDPAFTIVGPDRVHPGESGHAYMAYVFLKAQQMSPWVAKMVVDAKSGDVVESVNCTIRDVAVGRGGGVAFTSLEGALPLPIAAGAAGMLKWVPFERELNQEVIGVAHLPDGRYEIVIDDVAVAVASAAELSKGVNLAANPKTPMLQQACAVQKIEDARRAVESNQLRVFAMWRQWVGAQVKDPEDFEAMKAAITRCREQSANPYIDSVADVYIASKPKEAELKVEVETLTDDLWKSNQPKPHAFIIRKAG